MNILQRSMERSLKRVPEQVAIDMVAKKLEAQGYRFTARDRRSLSKALKSAASDSMRLKLSGNSAHEALKIEFTPDDIRALEQQVQTFFDDRLPVLIRGLADEISEGVFRKLSERWPAESDRQRKDLTRFRRRLGRRWKKPLEGLRMLLTVARECGAPPRKRDSEPHTTQVLTRLHARACQIADEVTTLLEAGFADGALARWRALHEVAVVAFLISQHREPLAERYVAHQKVESYAAAREYQKACGRLGSAPMTAKEMNRVRQQYYRAIRKFGRGFKTPYGWACGYVRNTNRPGIADIERAAGIDQWRPYYRVASHPVHANPKGAFFKLGLLRQSEVLLAGPSNAGLADPGHCTAISLTNVTACLLLRRPTLDNLVAVRVMNRCCDEIGESFAAGETRLRKDDAGVARLSGT